jgi:hypothetical protein
MAIFIPGPVLSLMMNDCARKRREQALEEATTAGASNYPEKDN